MCAYIFSLFVLFCTDGNSLELEPGLNRSKFYSKFAVGIAVEQVKQLTAGCFENDICDRLLALNWYQYQGQVNVRIPVYVAHSG